MKNVLITILFTLCVMQAAECCSLRGMELQRVSPDITVLMTHNRAPVAGIEVQVVPENSTDTVFTGVSDKSGVVSIRDLATGKYYLSASHMGFEAGKEWIEVVPPSDEKTKNRFEFEWDSDFQTRRFAGKLTGLVPGNTGNKLKDIIYPKETVYPGVSITLRNAFGSDEFRTISDSSGEFVLDYVPDGIYVLIIAGGMKSVTGIADETRVIIDITQKSSREFLPLRLHDTGCYQTLFALHESSS